MRTIKTIIVIYAMLTTICFASSYYLESNWIKADDDTYINPVQLIKEHGDYLYVCGFSRNFKDESFKTTTYNSNRKKTGVVRSKSYHPRITSNQSVYPKRSGIVRLKKDGTIDKEWSSVFFNDVQVLAFDIMPDGKLVVAIDSINKEAINICIFDQTGKLVKQNTLQNILGIIDNNIKQIFQIVFKLIIKDNQIVIIGSLGKITHRDLIYKDIHFLILDFDLLPISSRLIYEDILYDYAFGACFQNDGKMILYGAITNYSVWPYARTIFRLNTDGSLDSTFNPNGSGFNGYVSTCIVLPDNSLLVGGRFNEYNKLPVSNLICKLTADGQIDKSFNSNVYGVWDGFSNHFSVETITPISGNRFLVGGMFSRYNSQDVNNLIMIDSSGQLLDSFDELLEYKLFRVHTICESANGDLYVGGACFVENCDTTKQIGVLKFSKSKGFVEFYLLYLSIICILGIAVFLIIRFRRK